MSAFAGIRRWLHLDRAVEDEVDEELAFHFERTAEELVAGGMSPDAAQAEARRRFGDLSDYRRQLRTIGRVRRTEQRRIEYFSLFQRHLRLAWRTVRRNPGFAAVVALTLGLGIGINAAMFGVLDRLLFSPPAQVRNPEEVRRVYVVRRPEGADVFGQVMSWMDVADLQGLPGIHEIAGFVQTSFLLGRGEGAGQVPVNLVSTGYFRLLGVRPALGRLLNPADDSTAIGTGAVVISHAMWQRQFGGGQDVLGRTMELGDGRFVVVGVAPPGFAGVNVTAVDAWLPLRPAGGMMASPVWQTSRTFNWIRAVARVNRGVPLARLEAEATARHLSGRAAVPNYEKQQARVQFGPLVEARGPSTGAETRVSLWAAAVSLAVLLVACANVANLLLFRAVRRRREIAIRLALGISRRQLIAELLTESMLFALLGAAGALLLAYWGSGLLHGLLQPGLAATLPAVSFRVILFTILIALLAGTMAGVAPAWLESRPDLLMSLKDSSLGGGGRGRLRAGLVVLQAALSVMLLVGAGLFVLSFLRVRSLNMGMDMSRVLVVSPTFTREVPDAEVRAFFVEARQRLTGIAGIEAVATSAVVPHNWNWVDDFYVPGFDSLPIPRTGGPYLDPVSSNYFETIGVRVIQGRGFREDDGPGSGRVVVLGETMARLIWPTGSALGKCVRIGSKTAPCTEVVGVVADTRRDHSGLKGEERMQYYLPLAQWPENRPAALMIRSARPLALAGLSREILLGIAPGPRRVETETLADIYAPEYRSWRTGAALFTAFGVLALLVSAVGLYSLLAYGVAQRTREIGVRIALGARTSGVVSLVLQQGVVLVGVGVVIGLALALIAAKAAAPLLFQTRPTEPFVYLAVAAVLMAIAILAGALPAWRATRVSPMTALRAD